MNIKHSLTIYWYLRLGRLTIQLWEFARWRWFYFYRKPAGRWILSIHGLSIVWRGVNEQ